MSTTIKCPLNNGFNCNPINNFINDSITQQQQLTNLSEKDYIILEATKLDYQEIYDFMFKDFLYTEPLNEALNVTQEDAKDFFAGV